mmetsp:Transcript_51473/g.142489  ORF Transcript_51473/g.142489 Transcript_51473/m.142489 type:complete len:221 (+) Transcript_51473:2071-2733(+)
MGPPDRSAALGRQHSQHLLRRGGYGDGKGVTRSPRLACFWLGPIPLPVALQRFGARAGPALPRRTVLPRGQPLGLPPLAALTQPPGGGRLPPGHGPCCWGRGAAGGRARRSWRWGPRQLALVCGPSEGRGARAGGRGEVCAGASRVPGLPRGPDAGLGCLRTHEPPAPLLQGALLFRGGARVAWQDIPRVSRCRAVGTKAAAFVVVCGRAIVMFGQVKGR